MVSVMTTLKVQSSGKPVPACAGLKTVLLEHTKEIASDLIDSCMKNFQCFGALMTDSDLVSEVKRNLFNYGKQNTANIMEAMLRRLVRALLACGYGFGRDYIYSRYLQKGNLHIVMYVSKSKSSFSEY
ncbi:A-Kinase Anchor Protein 4 [Manis pentadactyla]|nr:A-Kinase Anchor Protein 4 [Manis pentadactyla]